jgi:predicted transposase YbfD/YdcC
MMNLFTNAFNELKDPRVQRSQLHKFMDILGITVCATIGGAEGWEDIYHFVQDHFAWFQNYFYLNNGIPSPDTIRRVISRIDPAHFSQLFTSWTLNINEKNPVLIAIDGKTIRSNKVSSPLHIVSAWTNENSGLCLGQVSTGDKGVEYQAIPKLLEALSLKGALITIDAGGCYKEIANSIVESENSYCLEIKGNQKNLQEEVRTLFKDAKGETFNKFKRNISKNKSHGREESRITYIAKIQSDMEYANSWPESKIVGKSIRTRTIKGKTTISEHFFICSEKMSSTSFANAIRSHWGIENKLHWSLDMNFKEDGNKVMNLQGQENLSIARKISLNVLRTDDSNLSIAHRKKKASRSMEYIAKILGLTPRNNHTQNINEDISNFEKRCLLG